jgi:peptidyl-prolyl cis-trans isomerase C
MPLFPILQITQRSTMSLVSSRNLKLGSLSLLLPLLGACATIGAGSTPAAVASDSVVVSRTDGLALTTVDYKNMLANQARETLQVQADSRDRMREMVLDLHSDSVLAQEAEEQGLDKDPFVAARLDEARRKILSTARLLAARDAVTVPEDLETIMRERYAREKPKLRTMEARKVAHILLTELHGCPCEVKPLRERRTELHEQLLAGADFAEAARKWSVDQGSAVNGGELPEPIRRDGKTVPAFEDAVFALRQAGDISPPIRTSFGVHIIKLLEIVPGRQLTYEEVEAQLRDRISGEMRFSAMEAARGAAYPDPTQVDYDALEAAVRELIETMPVPKPVAAPVAPAKAATAEE